jgi:peptide/nickel transport system permease protein
LNELPHNISARQAVVLAQTAIRAGEHSQARRLAALAARLDPTDELPWLILAALASPRASLGYLQKAFELNPNSASARKGLAWAQERLRLADSASLAQPPSAPLPTASLLPPAESTAEKYRAAAAVALPPAARPDQEITRPLKVRLESDRKPAEFVRIQSWLGKTRKPGQPTGSSTLERVAKYTLVRAVTLFVTVVASLYLIIYIANLGGYLDTIQKGLIAENINAMLMQGWLKDTPPDQRTQMIAQTQAEMESSYGLDQPYTLRALNWLYRGITFNWGTSRFDYVISSTFVDGFHTQDVTTNDIRTEIISYLPRTLLLLGVSNLGLFVVSVLVALLLTRKPDSWIDRILVGLAPVSAVPSWMFGLILILLFYRLGINFSLGYSMWPTTYDLPAVLNIARGLFLPFLAIFLSKFFQGVYSWRTFFLVYSNEAYIELAKAKGLPPSLLERRYLLRPALPSILTSFAVIMISIWQECIAVEYFFNIGGIGGFFVRALNGNDIMVVVALVATFAYFLAITVFVLEIAYALTDPRLKIQSETQNDQPLRSRPVLGFGFWKRQKTSVQPVHLASQPVLTPSNLKEPSSFAARWKDFRQRLEGTLYGTRTFFGELFHFPSAVVGVVIITVLVLVSIATVIVIPYDLAIRRWRGDDRVWITNPIEAQPAWTNLFRQQKLPENITFNSLDNPSSKQVTTGANGNATVDISIPFDYAYDSYPQDVAVLYYPQYKTKQPFVSLTWVTPDGREIPIKSMAAGKDSMLTFSRDTQLGQKLGGISPEQALFSTPAGPAGQALKGRYELRIKGFVFESGSDLDAQLVVYGQVYGLAGTDRLRRDLTLVLLWGTVAALSFGILAAIATTIASVTLAAAGAWFGGWVDGLIQRISEINMVLPVLPTSILIFFLYSKSFWVILGVTVGLSIFGNSTKIYRSMLLQVKQAPYIEAASTYGASAWRIIFQYMIPRIRSVLIPQLVILVPSYIFFESTLSFLGVSDPFLPTLGKLLVTTIQAGIFDRPVYLTLEPFGMLAMIGLGFALLGFALERLFNRNLGI